jgi:23S rRNA G2069 N7-methylase RlmK/C1962 C5-methylase RlmI
LNCFSYTGAFSIHAGLGGAKEISLVDSFEEALDMAEVNLDLNHLGQVPHQGIRGNAFEVMRTLEQGYDIVILDSPPFAKKSPSSKCFEGIQRSQSSSLPPVKA